MLSATCGVAIALMVLSRARLCCAGTLKQGYQAAVVKLQTQFQQQLQVCIPTDRCVLCTLQPSTLSVSYLYLNMPLCTHAFSPDVSECHVLTRPLIFDMSLKVVHFFTRGFSSVLSSLQMQPAFCRTWSCVCMRSTKRAALAGVWRSCKRTWRACRTTMQSCRCARN